MGSSKSKRRGYSREVKVAIESIVESKGGWEPGGVVVTDLLRFPQCVGSDGGDVAKDLADEYELHNRDGLDRDRYFAPVVAPTDDAKVYLKRWQDRKNAEEDGKELTSECSNFSFDALAECLCNDELRANYDILQAGTMEGRTARSRVIAMQHNIAILVPKGTGADYPGGRTPLPDGSLIVDPWARAMGQPANVSLFVKPKNFCYKKSLYPLEINFNSANLPAPNPFTPAPDIEDVVRDFKKSNTLSTFLRKADGMMETDDNSAGTTEDISLALSTLVKETLGLEEDDVVTKVSIAREVGTFEITYTSSGQTVVVDQDDL